MVLDITIQRQERLSSMYFILKSEIELKKRQFCPFCNKTQIKRLDKAELYTKYSCWNKECKDNNTPFIILDNRILNEDFFSLLCENCQESYIREVIIKNKNPYLIFSCDGKMCSASITPYSYNLSNQKWEGNIPKFSMFEEQIESIKKREEIAVPKRKKNNNVENNYTDTEDVELVKQPEIQVKIPEFKNPFCQIGDIPLLTLNNVDYTKFLNHHQNKVVVLVDVPNYIRTLREIYPRDFETVLKKAYQLLRKIIESSFNTSDKYIIRYFSKPDSDLYASNQILMNYCRENPLNQFFHLLKIEKSGHFSDIDNYLIVNGVEILERCELRGFVIVSSDKDYLPVMRIATHKKVRKYIYGLNTADIYEKYGIDDIKLIAQFKETRDY